MDIGKGEGQGGEGKGKGGDGKGRGLLYSDKFSLKCPALYGLIAV